MSVVLLNHHAQQLRDPVRSHVDVLTRLRAEAVVPVLRVRVIAIVYELTESLVQLIRSTE